MSRPYKTRRTPPLLPSPPLSGPPFGPARARTPGGRTASRCRRCGRRRPGLPAPRSPQSPVEHALWQALCDAGRSFPQLSRGQRGGGTAAGPSGRGLPAGRHGTMAPPHLRFPRAARTPRVGGRRGRGGQRGRLDPRCPGMRVVLQRRTQDFLGARGPGSPGGPLWLAGRPRPGIRSGRGAVPAGGGLGAWNVPGQRVVPAEMP